jgi:hypothetical protein
MSVTKAIQGLENDLENAKQNHANVLQSAIVFEGQIKKLTSAIEALKLIGPDEEAAPIMHRTKSPGRKSKNNMPKTDSAFWQALITAKHQKTSDILAAAVGKLGITDAEKIAALKQRMPNALTKLLDEKKIKSEGQRLDRTYFV